MRVSVLSSIFQGNYFSGQVTIIKPLFLFFPITFVQFFSNDLHNPIQKGFSVTCWYLFHLFLNSFTCVFRMIICRGYNIFLFFSECLSKLSDFEDVFFSFGSLWAYCASMTGSISFFYFILIVFIFNTNSYLFVNICLFVLHFGSFFDKNNFGGNFFWTLSHNDFGCSMVSVNLLSLSLLIYIIFMGKCYIKISLLLYF